MFNLYAFTNTGERVIIDLGLPRHEALARTAQEVAFLCEQFHLELERLGDDWLESDGLLPRVVMLPIQTDPFIDDNHGKQWLPEAE